MNKSVQAMWEIYQKQGDPYMQKLIEVDVPGITELYEAFMAKHDDLKHMCKETSGKRPPFDQRVPFSAAGDDDCPGPGVGPILW